MKLTIGKHTSYLSIETDAPLWRTKELDDSGIYIDYDSNGEVIGIQITKGDIEVEYAQD